MSVTLEEAQAHLAELIENLTADEPLVITQGDHAIAQLMRPTVGIETKTSQFGCCRGMLTLDVEDDKHLEDFAEYMP